MNSSYAVFDRTNPQCVIVTFTGEKATDENFESYLEGLSENYNVDHSITVLFDATKAGFPSVRYQKMQAAWLQENEALMKKRCLGIAYTIPNDIIRQALKLIFKIQKQPVPFQVFSSNAVSLAWLKERLEVDAIN